MSLLETGAAVRAGDVVMEFDPADQQHLLEQNLLQLQEAEQEIIRLRADAEVRGAQADVELLTARFDVRRAEMDASTPAHAPAVTVDGSDDDPLATKLALAEEFNAIGDADGARALVEEVIAEASGNLKTRAQRLLTTLG